MLWDWLFKEVCSVASCSFCSKILKALVKRNEVVGEQKEDTLAMQIKTSHWFTLGDYVVGNFCFINQYNSMLGVFLLILRVILVSAVK